MCHTVFYNAAAVFYHLIDIEEFLISYPDPNKLLQSVHFDWKQKVFQAGVKGLAITDKLITGPMWRCIEAADSILDLNEALHKLQQSLEKLSLDASTLLQGWQFDDEHLNFRTQMALQLIFEVILNIARPASQGSTSRRCIFEPKPWAAVIHIPQPIPL